MTAPATATPNEPIGWAQRVSRARAAVKSAGSLDELAEVLNSPDFAALPLKDLVTLPTFGGDRPRGSCVFSWDASRILVMNEVADGFVIERRAR